MKMRIVFALLLTLFLTACVSKEERAEKKGAALRIDRLMPDKVMAGADFNFQANQNSAMSIVGANLGAGSRIKINGEPLETSVGTDGQSLAALVPRRFYAKEGTFAVSVDMPDGRTSNTLPFIVLPTTGPAPSITQLFPDTAQAGKAFNVQPGNIAAMGLTGANFLPSAKILLNGEPQETNFGDIDRLGCVFPAKFFAKAGVVKVTVKNPDGKVSPAVDFVVK
ncbi:MAG: hypothetical protein K2X03_18140 [Bryobacteraceae bacterium]|nr:hypothetical protein [Bryobacteraceae bacterium]